MEQHFCNPLTIPGLAVGRDYLEGIYLEGNLFVDTTSDVGYVGFVFSYQDNSKFYVVMWKKTRQVDKSIG